MMNRDDRSGAAMSLVSVGGLEIEMNVRSH